MLLSNDSLFVAFKALGQLPNLNLIEELRYAPIKRNQKIKARVCLFLSDKDTPTLLQVNNIILKDWHLNSGWQEIEINKCD